MKMYFYRGDRPNFGDELNPWLLPKVFPGFFNEDETQLFLGIGSILFDSHPKQAQKIVFGSGYGGYTKLPQIDETWSFYCVRGPRTAAALHLDQAKVAGDSGILIARHFQRTAAKPSGYSFMPHFESAGRGNWEAACALAGIRLIDPRGTVDQVLEALDQTEVLITEAMHGAIVADAIRVPWIPVLPLHKIHRMKWYDWAEALDLTLRPHRIFPSSVSEAAITFDPYLRLARSLLRPVKRAALRRMAVRRPASPAHATRQPARDPNVLDRGFIRLAAQSLVQAAKQPPMLSNAAALDRVLDRLETHAQKILADFGGARPPAKI